MHNLSDPARADCVCMSPIPVAEKHNTVDNFGSQMWGKYQFWASKVRTTN